MADFLHVNLRTVGDIPRSGLIPVGEQDSAVCEAEKEVTFQYFLNDWTQFPNLFKFGPNKLKECTC